MTLDQYIANINQRYKLGNATEHTFRGDLQQLLESLVPDIRATNEPKRQSCGAPDYILTKKEIPVGFIEAKDIGDKDLEGAKKTGNKEQFDRYKASLNNLIFTDDFNELPIVAPNYFFVSKDFDEQKDYDKCISINSLFKVGNSGVVSKRDKLNIHNTKQGVVQMIDDVINLDETECRRKYFIPEDVRDWNFSLARQDIKDANQNTELIQQINYRPFDKRYFYYTGKSKGVVGWPVPVVSNHLLHKDNLGFMTNKKVEVGDFTHYIIYKGIVESHAVSMKEINYVFPLYFYPETTGQQTIDQTTERTPNLNTEIVKQIADKIGLTFVPEKTTSVIDHSSQGGVYSPPSEGCLQGGVVLTTINNTPIYRNFVENLPHNPSLNQLAKDKRKAGILSEVLFWQQVHKGNFHKIDFDRQRIIGNYIVDFYVKTLGLIVEIDGSSHDDKVDYDTTRQAYLESLGLKVFRCTDIDMKKNINAVFMALEDFIIKEYSKETTPVRGKETTPDPSKETTPVFDHPSKGGEFAPIDLLDYIYAVLHSPTYREKYKEFLKIDFPRVPYPKDAATFWQLVKLGGEIRQIHLLESPTVEKYITQYPIDGDNVVDKIRFETYVYEITMPDENGEMHYPDYLGSVRINETQYFADVPTSAWEFYIGGYQPAQKWLKDRKGRTLEYEDILHYQKIIVALSETNRLMKEIDKIEIE